MTLEALGIEVQKQVCPGELAPEGYAKKSGDCNDSQASTFPTAEETCDDVDGNCDGVVDTDLKLTYYEDKDGDSVGGGPARLICPTAFDDKTMSIQGGDCNDDNDPIGAAQVPGSSERCDGIDNDCDGQIDQIETLNSEGIRECTFGMGCSVTRPPSQSTGSNPSRLKGSWTLLMISMVGFLQVRRRTRM